MKTQLVGMFTIWCLAGYAQTYYPMPDSNAVWNINLGIYCEKSPAKFYEGTYSIVMKGDTVFNGKTYKQLWVPYFIMGYDFFATQPPQYKKEFTKAQFARIKQLRRFFC